MYGKIDLFLKNSLFELYVMVHSKLCTFIITPQPKVCFAPEPDFIAMLFRNNVTVQCYS